MIRPPPDNYASYMSIDQPTKPEPEPTRANAMPRHLFNERQQASYDPKPCRPPIGALGPPSIHHSCDHPLQY